MRGRGMDVGELARERLRNLGHEEITIFSNESKAACAEREFKLRKRVYPTRIENGRMSKDMAHREAALMAEICREYRAKADADALVGTQEKLL